MSKLISEHTRTLNCGSANLMLGGTVKFDRLIATINSLSVINVAENAALFE